MVGIGNINKLSRMFHESSKKSRHNILPVKNLQQIHDELKPLTIEERISQYSLKPDRADVIIPAAEIFLNVANQYAYASLFLSHSVSSNFSYQQPSIVEQEINIKEMPHTTDVRHFS